MSIMTCRHHTVKERLQKGGSRSQILQRGKTRTPVRFSHQASDSEKRNTPSRVAPAPVALRRVRSHSCLPPVIQARPRIATPVLLFLFWTVHGPFSLFLLEEKEKMGGAKAPAIFMAEIPPPARKGEKKPPCQEKLPLQPPFVGYIIPNEIPAFPAAVTGGLS